MIYVVKYLVVFDMVIAAFLTLRMSEWLCRVTPLLVSGKRELFWADLNEYRHFKLWVVRAGTVGLIIMTVAVLNSSKIVFQIAGLATLGVLLVCRWLYFVKHPPFALGALAIALVMPLLVIAKGMPL